MFKSRNARGVIAVVLISICGIPSIQAALLGIYNFSSDTTAGSLGADISAFSIFNDNPGGGVTGSVNTTAPGFYHTSASWNTTFTRYVQFTVTPVNNFYIIPNDVMMSVRQNDANSTTTMKVEVFMGTTLLDSSTATLARGQNGGPFSTLTFNFTAANFGPANAGPLAFRIEAMINDGGNNYLDFNSVSLDGATAVPENVNVALIIFGLLFGAARMFCGGALSRSIRPTDLGSAD
jgi:hypothetical protein